MAFEAVYFHFLPGGTRNEIVWTVEPDEPQPAISTPFTNTVIEEDSSVVTINVTNVGRLEDGSYSVPAVLADSAD